MDPARRRLVLRVLLVGLALPSLVIALWALASPQSFYDGFPGLGQVWVGADGPFNEHLIRDFGSLNLALAVVALLAARSLAPGMVRAAAWAWVAYTVPHLAYHLANPLQESMDHISSVGALGTSLVAAGALLVLERSAGQAGTGVGSPAH